MSWGDSRIGNVMYRDFEPVGVLDWEMAGVGPRELDVSWLAYAHRVFEDLATVFELAVCPTSCGPRRRRRDLRARTGVTLRDLEWYST